jgi:hypothetical protein
MLTHSMLVVVLPIEDPVLGDDAGRRVARAPRARSRLRPRARHPDGRPLLWRHGRPTPSRPRQLLFVQLRRTHFLLCTEYALLLEFFTSKSFVIQCSAPYRWRDPAPSNPASRSPNQAVAMSSDGAPSFDGQPRSSSPRIPLARHLASRPPAARLLWKGRPSHPARSGSLKSCQQRLPSPLPFQIRLPFQFRCYKASKLPPRRSDFG